MNESTCCPDCDTPDRSSPDGLCRSFLPVDGRPTRCVGNWTEDKHYYLRRYCKIFNNGMKKKWNKRIYVDLFAGPGRCRIRPDGRFVDGSPMIAAGEEFTDMLFVDFSTDCVHALEHRLKPFADSRKKNITILPGDCNRLVPSIVNGIPDNGLGFAFIDPPGLEINFSTIQALCDNTRLDLLIIFPLGMNIKRQLHYQTSKMDLEETTFDRYFGTQEWRSLCDTDTDGVNRIGDRLLKFYMNRLESIGYSHVGDLRLIRNRGRLLYHLIFASKHNRGRDFWNKIANREPDGQRSLF